MDFINEIKAIFDIKKLPTKFFLLFSLVSGFVLFADDSILAKLYLNNVKEKYGDFIGIFFLLTTGLVLINFSIWLYNYIVFKKRFGKSKKEMAENIRNLDPHEKAVIREFAVRQQYSVPMPYDDPVISGLLEKGILKFNKQFGNSMVTTFGNAPISLTKYAEKFLRLEDIDLKENPSEEEIEKIHQNRPNWVDRWNR